DNETADNETAPGETADNETAPGETADNEESLAELRERVEQKYDFENFGPADMAEMSLEEWQAAFDHETWITGEELLDRVADDLATRVANREVFARIERQDRRLVAYSDEGYAAVYPDGSVRGEGTVLRDVKPSVALCSMDSYDVPEPPADVDLPDPQEVPEGSGELGNVMLQAIAAVQVLAGLVLFGGGAYTFGSSGGNAVLLVVAGLGFLTIGVVLFMVVANARLSDKFRAEEYRNRLRAVGLEDGERPEFVPGPADSGTGANVGGASDAETSDAEASEDGGDHAEAGEDGANGGASGADETAASDGGSVDHGEGGMTDADPS
ncbi:MAG: hypothetical protein ABEJ89_05255, partial [Haloarculaceae archaeon]